MITREFYKERQLMTIHYTGIIHLEDVQENIHRVFNDYVLPLELHVLEDAREAAYDIPFDGNDQILDTISTYVGQFEKIKAAMVQDKPLETAINLEYQHQIPFPNFHYKVFTTMEAAHKWLFH